MNYQYTPHKSSNFAFILILGTLLIGALTGNFLAVKWAPNSSFIQLVSTFMLPVSFFIALLNWAFITIGYQTSQLLHHLNNQIKINSLMGHREFLTTEFGFSEKRTVAGSKILFFTPIIISTLTSFTLLTHSDQIISGIVSFILLGFIYGFWLLLLAKGRVLTPLVDDLINSLAD